MVLAAAGVDFEPLQAKLAGRLAPVRLRLRSLGSRSSPVFPSRLITGLEILAIGAWALWVGRNLLDFDPEIWPIGREFGVQVYGFHIWDLLQKCGACSLWNGFLNGGSPYLADPFTGALHPVSAVAGILAGAVNGAKLTVLASIWMAGIGQWWIGKVLGLGRWSRLWAGLAATSGGHILGRMELGAVALVLSTAASSLALAGAIDLAIKRSRRAALRLTVVLALAILAGHGYLQVALLFWAPWIALIASGLRRDQRPPWREFAVAGALAILMAGVFLVPFVHVWPSLDKFTDPLFAGSQPFEYLPLNLVIHDWDYYLAGGLGSTAFPYLHTLFIGWPAVLLAGVGLARCRPDDRRLLAGLSLGAVTMFWLASGIPFRWAAVVLPSIAAVRHVVLMASLAVPAVLALAGYGLDRLLELVWPSPVPSPGKGQSRTRRSFRPATLLAIPLAAALIAADDLDQHFLTTDSNSEAYQAVSALRTSELQWVAVPEGEHFWVEPALDNGLKLTGVVAPFWRRGLDAPLPFLEATRFQRPPEARRVASLEEVPVYWFPENLYAYVEMGPEKLRCTARGLGGQITVSCERGGGTLIVHENAWPGWSAMVNRVPTKLQQNRWLALEVPSGPVEIRLRYLPVDAIVGIVLSLAGVTSTVLLWRRAWLRAKRSSPQGEP